jgi:hypothetical protein
MDATRKRRRKDSARQLWYSHCRQRRFARFLGFGGGDPILPSVSRSPAADGPDGVRNPMVLRMADQLTSHAQVAVNITPLVVALDELKRPVRMPAVATW